MDHARASLILGLALLSASWVPNVQADSKRPKVKHTEAGEQSSSGGEIEGGGQAINGAGTSSHGPASKEHGGGSARKSSGAERS